MGQICAGKIGWRQRGAEHLCCSQARFPFDPADFQNEKGAFSTAANSIEGLQQRGVVFLACHNAAWEVSERLIAGGTNPDRLSIGALCADLTNHLIPGVIMTPGAVGTLVELARAGFSYAR